MKRFIGIICIAAAFIFLAFHNAFAKDIQHSVLKNGLVVLIEESPRSSLVGIEARIKTGSAAEQGYLGSGISHFVEHMLFKGTQSRPRPGDIEKEIKSLGGYINAFTSHDSTGVDIIVPSDYIANALEILKDVLTESLFDPQELEKEREVILKEIRLNRDDPARYLSLLLWSNMFKTHNYRFPVIGYEDIFKKLKREDLINYYRTKYIPDNIVLAVCGDVNSEETLKKIDNVFGQIEKVSPDEAYSPQEPLQITDLEVEEERELALAYVAMGFHSVAVRDKDLFSLDVLSLILGGGEDSRLFKSLYRDKRLVYSIGGFNHTPKDPGIFAINAVLKKENVQKAIDDMWYEIERLKTNLISDKELKKAKNQVLSAYIFSRQTVQAKASDLANSEILTGDYDFSRKYVEGIKAITKESVREAAKRYLKKENVTIIKLLPKEERKIKEAEERPGAAILPKVERFELKNGLRVLLLEDHSLPIISLTAVGLGGLRSEDFRDNGISNLVSEMLLCGTKTRTEDEISAEIEGLGASLDSFSGSNSFGLSASCLSKDIDPVLEIFSDVMKNPAFGQEKVLREKSTIQGGIKSIDDDIYQSGIRTLKYALYRRHPYRFQTAGRLSTVGKLSQKEILDYYRTYYLPNNMVLAVSGDFDKKALKEKIIKFFERFKKEPLAKIAPPKEKKRTRPREILRKIEKEQSLILLGYLGTSIDSHDKYALGVLSSILSGINGRLSEKIREQMGLAYALDVGSVAGIEPGMIIFYIGTTKENLETVKRELFKEIELFKKEGLIDEELASSKSELIGLQKIGLQKIQNVALQASLDELYGLGYDNFLKYENRIRHITKECVQRAARKYLRPDSYVLVVLRGNKEK